MKKTGKLKQGLSHAIVDDRVWFKIEVTRACRCRDKKRRRRLLGKILNRSQEHAG